MPAGGIVVDTPSGLVASESSDGYCDILEALAAATSGRTVRECANPTASTRIVLRGGASYPIGKTLRFATAAGTSLQVAIAEGTNGRATIVAAERWLFDPGDPPTSCLVHVSRGSLVDLSDVTLTAASALRLSGACLARGGLTIRRGRVTGFRAGGVVANCLAASDCDAGRGDSATLRVESTLVDGNATDGDGAGVYSVGVGAAVAVYHSAIVHNTAAGAGGGLYLGGGAAPQIVESSTVSGNVADRGGGMMVKLACATADLDVVGSTIADNTANGSGGGLQFEPAEASCGNQVVSAHGSIVAANHSVTTFESNVNAGWWTDDAAETGGRIACDHGSFIYVAPGYPLPASIDGSCVLTRRDPRLGPLTQMGGVGDLPAHPLLAGSPTIDVGSPDAVPGDQRDAWIPLIDPPLADGWRLFDRMADGDGDGRGVPDLGPIEMNPRWQTELLEVAAQGPSSLRTIVTPAGWDCGAGTEYAATSASNELVTYRVPIAEPGYYDFTAGFLQAPMGGTFQLAVANDSNGPWTALGPPQDTFAVNRSLAVAGPFTGPLFPTTGVAYVRFSVTGRNDASAGYVLALDYVEARRSARSCPIVQLASGVEHVCALTAAGSVRCWGANESGQLGDGATATAGRPSAADTFAGATAIAAGARHTCVLTAAGGVRCWGANESGQLGDGTTIGRLAPPSDDAIVGIKSLAAGSAHTCALTTAGGVRCWGANESGQLGDGTTIRRLTPPTADALSGVGAIAAGGSVTCALMQTGGVRCWGANAVGQLGDGTTLDRSTPPASDVIGDVAALAVASGHTCVVTAAAGVRCWGHSGDGELGDGTYNDALIPPATDILGGARAVAAGPTFTCALTGAGGVRCWGYNSDGQLGDETENAVDRLAPATSDILDGVQAISVGSAHTCALTTAGGVRCWGANSMGQLGDGLAPEPAPSPPPQDIVVFNGTCR